MNLALNRLERVFQVEVWAVLVKANVILRFPSQRLWSSASLLKPLFSPTTPRPLSKAQATTDKSISRLPGPRLLISDPRILLPPPKTLQVPPPQPDQTRPIMKFSPTSFGIIIHLLWSNPCPPFGTIDCLCILWPALGMPSFQKSAVFLNIVQKAFDPPPLYLNICPILQGVFFERVFEHLI